MFADHSSAIGAAMIPFVPLAANGGVPVVILLLCAIAGIATVMLLPSRRDVSWRRIGGALLLTIGLIATALLVRRTAGPTGLTAYFWIFAAIAIVSAMRVITHPRPVYSALYFVLTVMASAGLFILLWAEFMAVALVLIYAGAILVTYVFVIMLAAEATSGSTGTSGALAGLGEYDIVSREPIVAASVGFALMAVLIFLIFDRAPAPEIVADQISDRAFTTAQLGNFLFQSHLVSLELAGLILTIAMVGAIVIARRQVVDVSTSTEMPVGEVITGPATPVNDNPHSIPVYGTDNPRQKAFPET